LFHGIGQQPADLPGDKPNGSAACLPVKFPSTICCTTYKRLISFMLNVTLSLMG
jgi:hypothetical protein